LPPPVSVDGLQLSPACEDGVPGAGRSVNTCDPPPKALTTAVDLTATEAACAVNVALIIPVPIVTDGGTDRLTLLELREKVELVGAGLVRLMVQVLLPGVWTLAGLQTKDALAALG